MELHNLTMRLNKYEVLPPFALRVVVWLTARTDSRAIYVSSVPIRRLPEGRIHYWARMTPFHRESDHENNWGSNYRDSCWSQGRNTIGVDFPVFDSPRARMIFWIHTAHPDEPIYIQNNKTGGKLSIAYSWKCVNVWRILQTNVCTWT